MALSASSPGRVSAREVSFQVRDPISDSKEVAGRAAIIETLRNGDGLFRAYYSPDGTRLLALEEFDTKTQRPVAFKHHLLIGGEETWSGWIPASLRPHGATQWPASEAAIRDSSGNVRSSSPSPSVQEAMKEELRIKDARFRIFADPPKISDASEFNWQPGEYVWKYSPEKIRIWLGYLWSFRYGRLIRGYRANLEEGDQEVLTPSQKLSSSNPAAVRDYYEYIADSYVRRYTPDNSRWLSPLDKWGMWTERRSGRDWWSAATWEALHHFLGKSPWTGYCNSSSVLPYLWKQPVHGVLDQNLLFDPRDLVGLMQVASYKVNLLFWGNRYNGEIEDDLEDPSPSLIVELLQRYLGKEQIPLVMDYDAGTPVQNALTLQGRLQITHSADPLVRNARLELGRVNPFDDQMTLAKKEEEALVPGWDGKLEKEEFTFKIFLNPDGSLKKTEWDDKSKHPDFVWLPVDFDDPQSVDLRNPHASVSSIRELVDKSY